MRWSVKEFKILLIPWERLSLRANDVQRASDLYEGTKLPTAAVCTGAPFGSLFVWSRAGCSATALLRGSSIACAGGEKEKSCLRCSFKKKKEQKTLKPKQHFRMTAAAAAVQQTGYSLSLLVAIPTRLRNRTKTLHGATKVVHSLR